MRIQEFTIPLNNQELVDSHFGNRSLREIVPVNSVRRALEAFAKNHKGSKPPHELIEEHFDVFGSVLIHGDKLDPEITLLGFKNILILADESVTQLKRVIDSEMPEEVRISHLNAIKMFAYFLSTLMSMIEDHIADTNNNNVENIGRRKKATPKSDIEEDYQKRREKAIDLIGKWLDLPLKNLWKPPIVEDSFVGALSQMCYKVLERTKDYKSDLVKRDIFEILGTLVKKYNHGIACVVRIIHLAKFNESLAAPLGTGISLMASNCHCTGLIKQILGEIMESEPGEKDAKNYSIFIEAIFSANAEIALSELESIMDFLGNDCYVLRNCAVEVMCTTIIQVLTQENLSPEKRQLRDDCLSNLLEHILDCNAYVRSRVLSVWQRLCCEGAVPLSRQIALLRATVLRLEDKSANVRKQALQLLRAILQGNPFASTMKRDEFVRKLEQEKAELKQMQTNVYHIPGAEREKEELWETQLPRIEAAFREIAEEPKSDSENEDEGFEENREIDYKAAYDKIQKLILKDRCLRAVKYLQSLFSQSGLAKDIKNISEDIKQEAMLLFMYKIFINSSKENAEGNSQTNKTSEEELKQLDQVKVKRKIVDYLQNCLTFTEELERCLPIVENLLYSVNPGDGIEACSFLGTACQFQVPGSLRGVRKALFQIFCKDQSVRDNLVMVYKDIYLKGNDDQLNSRQRALRSVKALVELLDGMEPGQSPALAKLVTSWRSNDELDAEALRVMWEMFSMKLPNTTTLESRAALMLLSMAAQAESNIIIDNLDVLIKIGLGERAETDLLLARDTCRAFLNIKQDCTKDINKSPIKYPNDYVIFERLSTLLKENIKETRENGYVSFATDAINVIFHLADQPDAIMEEIMRDVAKNCNWMKTDGESTVELTVNVAARLLFLVGHLGIRKMVHLDQSIYKELKRRNAIKEARKEANSLSNKSISAKHRKSIMANVSSVSIPSSANRSVRNRDISYKKVEDDQDDGLEGATADDMDAEHINHCLENELLVEGSYLSKFVPIILHVCQHPDTFNDESLQGQAVTALSKFMTISSSFCESNLQLLVTILERSAFPQIRANILVGLTDLMTRFPNQIEPWTSHIYGRLKDDDLNVRSTCVRMLSSLILGEMIRVKGQVAQLALCLVDENETIKSDAKQLFRDLSQKGNALYNVMPDILSCLSDSELNLPEPHFQEIIKYILGLLQKERQVDSIIEKLCSRFKLATTERQWEDLSYCLSLLKFSAKSIRLLIKDLPLLKDKIHNEYVLNTLNNIIEQAKKRPDAKTACLELEEKIKELLEADENGETEAARPVSDTEAMPPPPEPVKSVKKKRRARR